MPQDHPLLASVAPEFALELTEALAREDLDELADQIEGLEIWTICTCGDQFCSSFYVGAKPQGSWNQLGEHHNVAPDVTQGMVVFDVVDDVIMYIEVLDRPDVRKCLDDLR